MVKLNCTKSCIGTHEYIYSFRALKPDFDKSGRLWGQDDLLSFQNGTYCLEFTAILVKPKAVLK